jgi:molybdopterin-guanine dinucleotide biosynthesis protein MobB
MKIIHIVGRSNSGKTTFIRQLIPSLKKIGTVGAIKHLGHHDYHLEEGKDTTLFCQAGADAVAGIDSRRSVIVVQDSSIQRTLRLLYELGLDFVVIEGYKQLPLPKIVIGRLTINHCILQDPAIEDVINSLHQFADYPECIDTIKDEIYAITKD